MMRFLPMAAAAGLVAAAAVRRGARRAERASPPLGRFAAVDGVHLHYVDAGDGPPLVLLHGLGSMIEDFVLSGLVGEAAGRYRVIAVDRPGYGRSTRPRGRVWDALAQARLLRALLHQLQAHRPIVLGHSWGALVATAFALEYPATPRSLVLASGLYFPSVRLDAAFLAPPGLPHVGALLRNTVAPLLGRALWPAWLRLIFSPAPVPQRFRDYFPAAMALRPSQLRAVGEEAIMTLPTTTRLARRYGELKLPIFLVAGERDRYVRTAAHSARLHRLLPASRLLSSPHAGHMVHHADLPLVLDAIDAAAWPV